MTSFRELCAGLAVPEGPIALADGSVLVVEVLGGRLTRVTPDGSHHTMAHTGGGPNGAAIGPDGDCYICNNGGIPLITVDGKVLPDPDPAAWQAGYIQRVNLASGEVATLYTDAPGYSMSAPNDLVFDTRGGSGSPTTARHGRPRANVAQSCMPKRMAAMSQWQSPALKAPTAPGSRPMVASST